VNIILRSGLHLRDSQLLVAVSAALVSFCSCWCFPLQLLVVLLQLLVVLLLLVASAADPSA
jgi:hypothetical protein